MRRLLPPVLLVALALVGGCGGDDDSSADVLADAASKTTEAGSARIAFTGSSDAGLPQSFEISGKGVVDNANRVGRLEFDFSSLASSLPPGADLSADELTGEVIFEDFVFYMRFPVLSRLLPERKEWVRFDLEEVSKAQGIDLSQFTQFGQADPSQALQYLRAVSGEVEEKGREDVRGVPTTRYEATVDLRKFPDVLPDDQREAAEKSVDTLVQQLGGKTELPMEVWIDDDGLIRRQRFEFAFEAQGQEVSFRYDSELYDFGVDVEVQPPPAEDTADLGQLIAQQAGAE
jgi:hypothetical protein